MSMQPNSVQGGKANTPSSYSLVPQQTPQPNQQSFEASNRRSSSQSSQSRQIIPTGRHNQSLRKQHKNQRRPRLADEDALAESAAMRNATNRRGQTSITHLMHFSLPPRPQHNPRSSHAHRRNITYGFGSGHTAIDKARYINANYRFVVNPNGDYRAQAVDADSLIEWNNVLQILVSGESQGASCPICLSDPVGPRMAKCGHIFCLPCLIRYMHSTDDSAPVPEKKARWKKCPICWDSIYLADTRPVRWYRGQENPPPRENEDVVLRLVMRQPGSTLALPRDGAEALAKGDDIPWYFAAEVADYARVMKGSEEYMTEQYDLEIEELRRQEKEDELMFGEETEWTRKAVKAIYDAKERIKGIGNPPALLRQPTEKKPTPAPIQFNESTEDVPYMYAIQHAAKSGQSIPAGASTVSSGDNADTPAVSTPSTDQVPVTDIRQDQPPPTRPHQTDSHHSDSPYYFYQALLHFYLAPLDIRILKSAFGTFSTFPSTILPRVERVSTGHIVDDELRKRAKYLAHLPYGCEVNFLECDWTDVVAPEVLERFQKEVEARRKRNREKETREERERVRAEREEEDKRWAAVRVRRRGSGSMTQPEERYSSEDFQPLAPPSIEGSAGSPPYPSRQGSAFASLASPSTSPGQPRTVWGTALIPPEPDALGHHASVDEGPHDDGWLQDWERELLEENELLAQVKAVSLENGGEGSSMGMGTGTGTGTATPTTGTGGGKKKKKKITLMSTTARRAA